MLEQSSDKPMIWLTVIRSCRSLRKSKKPYDESVRQQGGTWRRSVFLARTAGLWEQQCVPVTGWFLAYSPDKFNRVQDEIWSDDHDVHLFVSLTGQGAYFYLLQSLEKEVGSEIWEFRNLFSKIFLFVSLFCVCVCLLLFFFFSRKTGYLTCCISDSRNWWTLLASFEKA